MYNLRDVKTSEGPTKVFNLQIKDFGLSVIDVALWGKLAEDVHSELQTNTNGPVVLVGSLMKTRLYNGKGTVQSSKFASKVYINSTMPEITQFKEALLEGEERSSYAIVPIASSKSIQISKHTFSLSERITIDQITELNAGQSYDILAKIASTRSGKPWFFIGCTVCYTKVVPNFNLDTEEIEANKFSCVKCQKQITATQMRYKLYIQAIDHTSTASFLLFDDVVIQLINKSAYELREQHVQFDSSDQIPKELLALEGREYVFKILIPDTTAHNSSYRVVSLTEDPNIIKEFTYTHSNLIIPEGEIIAISGISDGTTNQTHNVSSEVENLDFSNSGNVYTSTPGTKRSQDVSSYVLEDLDSPNSSAVSMSTKTPKRSLPATQDVGVQHSSTKQKLLSKNQIKKEKK